MHPVMAHYLDRLQEAAELPPKEQDYLALDQSKYGTDRRHEAVSLAVGPYVKGGSVLELGCGTGLWLESLVGMGMKPRVYYGVDMIPEREPLLAERCQKYGIPYFFDHKDVDTRFEHMPLLFRPSVVVAIGVCGYLGYHALYQIAGLAKWMASVSPHGAISFPMVYDNVLGDGYLMRFDMEDVRSALKRVGVFPIMHKLEREFVVSW